MDLRFQGYPALHSVLQARKYYIVKKEEKKTKKNQRFLLVCFDNGGGRSTYAVPRKDRRE